MARKLITIALTAAAFLTLVAQATAGGMFDDWKDARHKYEKYIEKYHKEMRKAHEDLRDRDYDDYYEHLEKAQGNLRKANAYKREAERLERYAHSGHGGKCDKYGCDRDRKHDRKHDRKYDRSHSRRTYEPKYRYTPQRRRDSGKKHRSRRGHGGMHSRRGITVSPKRGWFFRLSF